MESIGPSKLVTKYSTEHIVWCVSFFFNRVTNKIRILVFTVDLIVTKTKSYQ